MATTTAGHGPASGSRTTASSTSRRRRQNIAQLLNPSDSKTGPLYASEIYRTFLALANSGRVELLDHVKMRTQLLMLERRTTPSGNDSITHPKGGHDDCINAAAGACVIAAHGGPLARRMVRFSTDAVARLRSGGRTVYVSDKGGSFDITPTRPW